MKKIVVAGCGHGGLVCAYHLARQGYDVTVYEKANPGDLGYDWEDCIVSSVFTSAGLPYPENPQFGPFLRMSYSNPKKNVKIEMPPRGKTSVVTVERKFLINHYISCCKDAGVKFVFNASVDGALVNNYRVEGISYTLDGKQFTQEADLVIDAAGMDSPVRKSLPKACGIMADFAPKDKFFTYRVYFENTTGQTCDPAYNIYFYHCGSRGMDWAITTEKYIDVLVGRFGDMPDGTAERAIEDFREEYPNMGKPVRGGSYGKIPVRRTISMFVCSGYAAVGDSAAMTEPMSGSGISLSAAAGRILAEVIVENGDAPLTRQALWKYQYTFLHDHAKGQLPDDILRNMMISLSEQDIDFLFENHIITAKELNGGGGKYTPAEIKEKLSLVKNPKAVGLILQMFMRNSAVDSVYELLPQEYDEEKIRKWQKKYDELT